MKFLKIAILLIGVSAFAQSKVGTVDVDYILANMPEMQNVQQQLETYGAQLDLELNKKIKSYKSLAEAYKTGETEFTISQKKEKQEELITLEDDIQKYQQNGAKLMDIKQQEFMKPLYTKIGEALEKVAQKGSYTQVIQTNDDLVFVDPNYDLTISILSEMGITVKPAEEDKK